MAFGETTIFTPERFLLGFGNEDGICIACKHKGDFDFVMHYIRDQFPFIEIRDDYERALEDREEWVSVYTYKDHSRNKMVVAVGADCNIDEELESDYWFEDIVFPTLNIIEVKQEDIFELLNI